MATVDRVIHHFSHPHPLHLNKVQQQQQQNPNVPTCSACKLRASGWFYSCEACKYALHITCSKVPQKIIHPSHPKHPLKLFTSPVYPEGVFACNACDRQGTGFCYHCEDCDVDIDILCASLRLSVSHGAHQHPLQLVFSSPYASKTFICDICGKPGSSQWLYRCSSCNFDADTACANSKRTQAHPQLSKSATLQPGIGSNRYETNPHASSPASVQQTRAAYMTARSNLVPHGFGVPYAVRPARSGVMEHLLEGIIEGGAQEIGQSLVQGVMGGGAGGGSFGWGNSSFGGGDPLTVFDMSSPLFSGVMGGDPSSLVGLVASSIVNAGIGLN